MQVRGEMEEGPSPDSDEKCEDLNEKKHFKIKIL